MTAKFDEGQIGEALSNEHEVKYAVRNLEARGIYNSPQRHTLDRNREIVRKETHETLEALLSAGTDPREILQAIHDLIYALIETALEDFLQEPMHSEFSDTGTKTDDPANELSQFAYRAMGKNPLQSAIRPLFSISQIPYLNVFHNWEDLIRDIFYSVREAAGWIGVNMREVYPIGLKRLVTLTVQNMLDANGDAVPSTPQNIVKIHAEKFDDDEYTRQIIEDIKNGEISDTSRSDHSQAVPRDAVVLANLETPADTSARLRAYEANSDPCVNFTSRPSLAQALQIAIANSQADPASRAYTEVLCVCEKTDADKTEIELVLYTNASGKIKIRQATQEDDTRKMTRTIVSNPLEIGVSS